MRRRDLAGAELTPMMQRTLDVLRQRPMRAAEVAAELGITRSTTGQYLWALSRARLIECAPRRGTGATWRVLTSPSQEPTPAPVRVASVWELGRVL
jgi:hypothetical protein